MSITLSKVLIDTPTKEAILKVLDSGYIVQGPQVAKLEADFCTLTGAKHAVAVSNGTTALHSALAVLGVGPGDEVITTPFTFVATANAIRMCGATPVFADINPQSFNLDPNPVAKAITKKTKAILVVNLYGLPADYRALKKICKQNSLYLVEDAAQSIGATYFGKNSGNLADVSCFSLYATKNLMSGEGGMLTTNQKSLAQKLKRFRHHGQSETKHYVYDDLGYNYRLTDIAATIALGELKKLDKNTKRRQYIAQKYHYAFSSVKGLITPSVPSRSTHVYHQYTIRLTKQFTLTRQKFQEKLSTAGIQTNIFYPITLDRFKHLNGGELYTNLPHSTQAAKEVISIPVHPYLTNQEIDYIIKTIASIWKSFPSKQW